MRVDANGVSFPTSVDSGAVADMVSLGAYDIGVGQRALSWSQEYAAITAVGIASTHKVPVRLNSVTIYLMASNV